MPPPLVALACVLAVLTPEAGSRKEDLLINPLDNLAEDRVKPLVDSPYRGKREDSRKILFRPSFRI
jgi:hypothetical protein